MGTGLEGKSNRNMNGQSDGSKKPKRQKKTFSQLKMLESTYASHKYPTEAVRSQLSESSGLTDRQLQMWFSHRRLKDKKKITVKQARLGSYHGSRSRLRHESGSSSQSDSGSESDSDSDSTQFNEQLVNDRAYKLTQQNMMLRSLADCAVALGEASRDDVPEEETQDVEEDSEPVEETQDLEEDSGSEEETQDIEQDSEPEEGGTTTTKMRNEKWTVGEEVALAKAWVNASKVAVHGNKKHASSFWEIILKHFKTTFPNTNLTVTQLHSKWKSMRKSIERFNEIFNKMYRGNQIGKCETDILKESLMEYQGDRKNENFNHMAAWKVIRNRADRKSVLPMGVKCEQSAKRSKTSASNTYTRSSEGGVQPIDVGIENEEFPSFEEVERPKRKSKTPESSTSTDTQVLMQMVSKLNSYFEQDTKKLDQFRSEKLSIKEQKKQASVRTLEAQERVFQKQERSLELQNKALERQEKKEDLEFFLKPHDHLSGPMLRVMLQQKQEIAEKWGWEWQ